MARITIYNTIEVEIPQEVIEKAMSIKIERLEKLKDVWFAIVRSQTDSQKKYKVFININRGLFYCSCKSWIFYTYKGNVILPDNKVKEVALCKHIVAVLLKIRELQQKENARL